MLESSGLHIISFTDTAHINEHWTSHRTVDTFMVTIEPSGGVYEQSVLFSRVQGRSDQANNGTREFSQKNICAPKCILQQSL